MPFLVGKTRNFKNPVNEPAEPYDKFCELQPHFGSLIIRLNSVRNVGGEAGD
jgi:hypothetical protein